MAVNSATITVPAITVDTEPTSATVVATNTQLFTATVGNDPNGKGVTWTVACSSPDCGSLSTAATASGGPTTYTAPSTVPPNDLTVTVSAVSATDTTKIGSATATVPAISVSPVSPSSGIIPVNATQDFVATISNDPTTLGVNWTLTQNGSNCSPACGTVSPAKTTSGTATTYTAPATLPATTTLTINAVSAADTTKSANAAVTLTNGIMKLIPASLAFSCKINGGVNKCPPPPQSITLTDTGAAALKLNNVSITGTNAAQFNETNNCGENVAAGVSCSLTVTFTPPSANSYTASVSLDDSSADSPQQITLSGKANQFVRTNQQSALSELEGAASASVPAPTGHELVGTREIHLVDASREDPYLADGTKRELAVRLWYPASLQPAQDCSPAPYTSPTIWNYFGQLVGVRPFPVKTNSCLNAPVAGGAHPVVLFTPGLTATFTDYTYLMEDLASRGYVVAAVAHTYEATAVELGDGRLAKSVLGSHLGGPVPADAKSLSTAVYARLLDLKFVVSEIERWNARDSAFTGRLDLAKIAVVGHSLGGLTALTASEFDPRFKAAILMDGFVPAELPSGTRKPVLILGAGRERWEPTECRLWNNLAGSRFAVNLPGTEHTALGDWIWLTKDSIHTGPMGPEKTMMAVRDYIAAFLDVNLRGMTNDSSSQHLLNGSSSEYPGVTVTTQEQALCSK
ncbi:MAG TPA: alpha/beta fold hydrolase [Dongiaceae bacterium]|nr:alpha/beta fold hydrolase [Dongiaceae bacterium]